MSFSGVYTRCAGGEKGILCQLPRKMMFGPDRQAKLWRTVHRAWVDVAADISKYSIWPRSRANMMFERLAVRLQEEFADEHPKVRFSFSDETVKIIFDERVLADVKKQTIAGLARTLRLKPTWHFAKLRTICLASRDFKKSRSFMS